MGCDLGPGVWEVLTKMAPRIQQLNVVTFSPCEGAAFTSLQSLQCNAIPRGLSWDTLPAESLTELSLSHVSDASLQTHLSKFRNIKRLMLVSCDSVSRAGFLAIARSPLVGGLEHLDLSSTPVDPYSLHCILKKCRKLKSLVLRDCTKLNDEDDAATSPDLSPSPAPAVPSAASLFAELRTKIKKVPTFVPKAHRDEDASVGPHTDPNEGLGDDEDGGKDALSQGFFVGGGVGSIVTEFSAVKESLTSLSVSGVGRLDDAGLRMLLDFLPNLTELSISKNRELTDEAFVSGGADGFPERLVKLSMSSCVGLSDVTLKAVADSRIGAQLRLLSVSNCFRMTPEGMRYVSERCTSLRHIWAFMMNKRNATLPNATQDKGAIIDGATMAGMWTNLPDLETLCCSFQRLGKEAFTTPHPHHIRSLEIDYCIVDPAAYAPFVSSFPLLTKLSMPSTVPVPETVLARFLATHPWLTLLRVCVTSIKEVHSFVRTSGVLQILDVEFCGTAETFEYGLWWDCYTLAKEKSVKMFLGEKADKFLNSVDGPETC
eukprot:TRINITY_DN22351_c0_g2_i3.p1 TRINITY_DN22351_c0_g2~~TRINITY_DN22351_c0_g2_i3.p1  ORF type:complete len:544 (+),score=169.32 TRINITY_DN22351_c0_g2_i3:517-2148(+)